MPNLVNNNAVPPPPGKKEKKRRGLRAAVQQEQQELQEVEQQSQQDVSQLEAAKIYRSGVTSVLDLIAPSAMKVTPPPPGAGRQVREHRICGDLPPLHCGGMVCAGHLNEQRDRRLDVLLPGQIQRHLEAAEEKGG